MLPLPTFLFGFLLHSYTHIDRSLIYVSCMYFFPLTTRSNYAQIFRDRRIHQYVERRDRLKHLLLCVNSCSPSLFRDIFKTGAEKGYMCLNLSNVVKQGGIG